MRSIEGMRGSVRIRGGDYTEAELAAANSIGFVNEYNDRSPSYECIDIHQRRLPSGFRLVGHWTNKRDYSSCPATIAARNPIKAGYIHPGTGFHQIVYLVSA